MRALARHTSYSVTAPSFTLPTICYLFPPLAIYRLLVIARERETVQRERVAYGDHWQLGKGWTRRVEDGLVTYTKPMDGE